MARLPQVSRNTVLTQAPRSSLSAADIANPYRQIADAFGSLGTMFQEQEIKEGAQQGPNAVYRDQDGTLKVDLRNDWSKSGEAYDRAAMQAYTARLAGDIRAKGSVLATESKGDVDAFSKSWKGFSDKILAGVPQEARGAVTTMLESEFSQFGLGVSEQKRKRDIKVFEGNIKAEIQSLDDDMAALARSGGTGTEAYKQKQGQLRSLYGELAANPEFSVGDREAAIEIKRTESRHLSEAMVGHVEKTLQAEGVTAAQKEADRILTDDSLTLTPAERRQYNGLANEAIRSFSAQRKVDLEPWKDKKKSLIGLLDEGIGIDSADVDETAKMLAAGGDMGGALELYSARARARVLSGFQNAGDADQVAALERGRRAAEGVGLPTDIISAMESVESGGDSSAVSAKGAIGALQVMPGTAAEIAADIGDKNFPATAAEQAEYLKRKDVSVRYGKYYFGKMLARYGGDTEAALIAYNGGAERADAWLAAGRDDGVIPAETSAYYRKVLTAAGAPEGRDLPIVTRHQAGRVSAPDMKGVQPVVIDRFRQLQRIFGASVPVVSGFRDPDRNRRAGGAKASQHMHGNALDLDVSGMPVEERIRLIQTASAAGFTGIGVYDNSIHIDVGGRRAWGPDHHSASVPEWARGVIAEHMTGQSAPLGPQMDPRVIKAMQAEVASDAKSLWGDMKSGMDKGFAPSADEVSLLSRQIAMIDDEDFRSDVSRYFETEAGAAQLAELPADQAASIISALKSDAADGASIAQQDLLEAAERGVQQKAAALKADPVGYAVDHKIVQPVPAIDMAAGPEAIGSALAARKRAVDLLRARGDVGNVSVLRPEDEQMIGRFMQTATPAEQAQFLGAMSKSVGGGAYMATMQSLSEKTDTRAFAAAGALYGVNPEVAEGIIRGRQLLRENSLLAPKQTDANMADIDGIMPMKMFAPALEGARQVLLDAATARYADLSHLVGDTSGNLNQDRMQQAVDEVTGGALDMNGATVIAPRYGMSQDEFDAMLDGLTDADLAGAVTADGTPIKAEEVRRYGRLRALAAGEYVLEFGPDGGEPSYAVASRFTADDRMGGFGGPFVLDLRNRR